MKHTKGEWKVQITKPLLPGIQGQVHVLTDFGTSTQTICQISLRKEAGANAKLIAAAPELLEALQEIVLLSAHPEELNNIGIIAKNAIKKATQ